jgi:NADPH:quinone reductase-like Zn-dependent oxidoreductase
MRRGEKWDVIFDATEGNHFRAFSSVLTPAGRYLTLYVSLRVLFEMLWTRLVAGPRALAGVALGGPDSSNELRDLVERGAFHAVIARRFPLEHVREAHHFFESTRPHGSVVIEVGTGQARSQPVKVAPEERRVA